MDKVTLRVNEKLSEKARKAIADAPDKSDFLRKAIENYVEKISESEKILQRLDLIQNMISNLPSSITINSTTADKPISETTYDKTVEPEITREEAIKPDPSLGGKEVKLSQAEEVLANSLGAWLDDE